MRRRIVRISVYTLAILVLLGFLVPIAWMLNVSFKARAQIFAWPPEVFAFTPTLENYYALVTGRAAFPRYVLNSVIVALSSTAIALMVGLPAAYALVGRRLRWAAGMRSGVLLFRMIPPVALLLPYYLMFRQVGLVGNPASIAISHFTFSIAIVVWMMRGAFASLPAAVEEAARVDGATPRQVFWFVALPMTRAAIAASAIFAILTSWNEFLFAVTLSRVQSQTVPVAVAGFVGDVYVSWGQLAAATVVGLLPALALAFLGQRWLLVGMGPGAVK